MNCSLPVYFICLFVYFFACFPCVLAFLFIYLFDFCFVLVFREQIVPLFPLTKVRGSAYTSSSWYLSKFLLHYLHLVLTFILYQLDFHKPTLKYS